MLAVRFAVQNAKSEEQVVENLAAFIDHLHRYRIGSILPEQLASLSALDAGDVRAWAERLRKQVHDGYCLTAAGQLWYDEIREAYFTACKRLDDLHAVAPAAEAQDRPEMVRRHGI